MGNSTQFSYHPSNFVLFRIDVRCKIICICLLSIVVTKADLLHLCLISATLSWFLYRSGVNIRTLIKELKYFFIILFFVFVIRAFVTPGIPISEFQFMSTLKLMGMDIANILSRHITKEGLIDGAKVSWRFLIIMIMGVLFSCSTTSSALKCAVMWFLEPVPFIPEKRVGIMISLFVRFLPLIFEKASEISDAQKSRCVHLQKNSVKKIKNITVPLLTKVFSSADNLAIAMTSRCYNDRYYNDNMREVTENHLLRSGYETHFYVGTTAMAAIILFL